MIDPTNPVVKLCIEGTQAEFQGKPDRAHRLYQQAWNASRDDYESCIAAHYLARHQESLHEKLRWNHIALEKAFAIRDQRVAEILPSLYVCLGETHELLGNEREAHQYYSLSAELGIVHDSSLG